MSKSKIKEAIIAVTYRCNSRCRMCNIWQIKDHSDEFRPDDLLKLPDSLADINLTGGEPFLRPDLKEIVEAISKKNSRSNVIISSNGFATDLIVSQVKKILRIKPNLGVAISIDGIGETHEEVRGIPGGFQKALNTLKELKKIGVKNLKVAFTVADYNSDQLIPVYKLSKELGAEFSLAAVHSSDNFFNKHNPIDEPDKVTGAIEWLIKKELNSLSPKRWARAYFAHGLKAFLTTGQRLLPDYSGAANIFIDPRGLVYPCDISSKAVSSLSELHAYDPIRSFEDCENSWMICTARQAMKKHKLKVLGWVMLNRLKCSAFPVYNFLKNYACYFFGLSINALNRIRHLIISYSNPRPISPQKADENIEYVTGVVDNIIKQLQAQYGQQYGLNGSDVLEIGPGQDLGTGIIYMSRGAKSYTAVDRFKLMVGNHDFYLKLIEKVGRNSNELARLIEIIDAATQDKENKEIKFSNFKYLNLNSESMSEKLAEKYDLVVSQAVLEHVENIPQAFGEMYKLMTDGGKICHEIDLKTHTTFLRDIDPLNILRYGKALYRILSFKGSPNRLRIRDYVDAAKKAGFKRIKVVPLTWLSDNEILSIRKYLSRPFKDQEPNELRILTAVLMAEK